MNILRTYLWKEWRDNRAIVIGLLLAVPVLLAIAKLAMPDEVILHHVFPPITGLSCYLVALLSLGSDLVPGEARRNRLSFLRRLPADLTAPFLAKAIFLAAMLTGFTVYGWGLACTFGRPPDNTVPELATISVWAFCLAPWVFAVSCWLPRGALAVPGGVLALALLGLPVFLMHLQPYTPVPDEDDVTNVMLALAGWSIVVAWISFARGYRFGRGIGSAAWRGLGAALVVFVPVWAFAGYRIHEWRQIDPRDEAFYLSTGVLSEDGRTVYMNAAMLRRDVGPTHVLRIDVETGAWSRLGKLGDQVVLPLPMRTSGEGIFMFGRLRRGPLAAIIDRATSKSWKRGEHIRQAWLTYLDADTGKTVKSGWQDMDLPEVVQRFGDKWIDLPKRLYAYNRNGGGWYVGGERYARIYDPFREKLYPTTFKGYHSVFVRPGRWLAVPRGKLAERHLLDPDTGEATPAKGLPRKKFAHQLMPDGRMLYPGPELLLVDPESGERHVLARDVPMVWSAGTTPGGHPVLLLYRGQEQRIARLDLKTSTLEYVGAHDGDGLNVIWPVAAFDDDTLLCVHSGKRLVRVRFGSDALERLWPK